VCDEVQLQPFFAAKRGSFQRRIATLAKNQGPVGPGGQRMDVGNGRNTSREQRPNIHCRAELYVLASRDHTAIQNCAVAAEQVPQWSMALVSRHGTNSTALSSASSEVTGWHVSLVSRLFLCSCCSFSTAKVENAEAKKQLLRKMPRRTAPAHMPKRKLR
jgi:hypothetical protein